MSTRMSRMSRMSTRRAAAESRADRRLSAVLAVVLVGVHLPKVNRRLMVVGWGSKQAE
jgi:hypothetical protein